MASASDDFSASTNNLDELIKKLISSVDSAIKIAKFIGEGRGSGALKTGGKITLSDGHQVGLEDLKSYVAKIKKSLAGIPKMVNDKRKAEDQAKRERRAQREQKPQPPYRYTNELVSFFKSVNLGHGTGSHKTLQSDPAMKYFFEHGIGNLTFGVSLFNVWGNIHKITSGSTKVVLDAKSKAALHGAIEHIKAKKQEELRSETDPKQAATLTKDLEDLNADEIKNKDYMSILTFYRDQSVSAADLAQYSEVVSVMSETTKQLNVEYREKIKSSRPAKAPKAVAPVAPVAPAAPVVKNVSMPVLSAAPTPAPKAVAAPRKR